MSAEPALRGGANAANSARRPEMAITKLLVVVDNSLASRRAVAYVAKLLGGRRGVRACLAHTLPSPPPELVEFGGASDPQGEERLDARLRARWQLWVSTTKKKLSGSLALAAAELRRAGFTRGQIEVHFCYPSDRRDTPEEILALARERRCHTVVVGRQALSWLRAHLQSNPADELVRRGKGFTVWVVE
jgi:nucleotide-binding universal stress UspA family protein